MKTLSKFILNRNDKVFYYVEKMQHRQGTVYYDVYLNSKTKQTYNQHNFHAIYGSDIKISISKFVYDAMNILIHGAGADARQERSYNSLFELSRRLQNFSKTNPKLDLKELIEALEIYNSILPKSIEESIDYNEDYMYVNGIVKETSEREHLKSVDSLQLEVKEVVDENDYNNEKGMMRIKKYD